MLAKAFITLSKRCGSSLFENLNLRKIQVRENHRQIGELTEDVVRTLHELAKLIRGREDVFQGPELLTALENLKV